MPRKSTTALILETVMGLSTDVADMKARIFNGLGQKVEALWAWKEEYPSLCSFNIWLREHPEMTPQVEQANRGRYEAKEKQRRMRLRVVLLIKDIILALAAIWGVGHGLGWW
jgi:hypothetical protein